MATIFKNIGVSARSNYGFVVPGAISIRSGGEFSALFEFLVQSYAMEIPERTETSINFGDATQVYTFGRGERTIMVQGVIPFRSSAFASKFIQAWENNNRAKKVADNQSEVQIELNGVGVFFIVPTRTSISRSLQSEALVNIDFAGTILYIEPAPSPEQFFTPTSSPSPEF